MTTCSISFRGISVETTVIGHAALVDAYISELRPSSGVTKQIVGLAVEWTAKISKVATLQLCVGSRCLMIQLFQLDLIPQSLKNFLSDPEITFVGSGISQDVSKLKLDYGLDCAYIELGPLAAEVLGMPHLRKFRLFTLAYTLLGFEDVKRPSTDALDWNASDLSMELIKVATIDAYASFKLGEKLLVEVKRGRK